LAKQNRSWEFDLEEGMLDAAKLSRVIVDPFHPLSYKMEKEMLAIAKLKSGEEKFEKFMGFMKSDKGMAVRKTIAHVEKTVPAIAPDKSYVMFKVSVHNEEEMKKFASGNNPIAKPIFDECIESVQMYELNKVNL